VCACVCTFTSFYFFTEFSRPTVIQLCVIVSPGNSRKFRLAFSHVGIIFLCGLVSKGDVSFFSNVVCPVYLQFNLSHGIIETRLVFPRIFLVGQFLIPSGDACVKGYEVLHG
jgi:hypothetical protein